MLVLLLALRGKPVWPLDRHVRNFAKLSRELQRVASQQSAMSRELEIQFTRIADLQADIDLIRSAWTKMKSKQPAKRERDR
jgi:hypothetical protein